MDHRKEQNNEIEALDSICCGEMERLACNLKFGYTEKYLDQAPEVEIEYPDNFKEGDTEQLIQHILDEARENLGIVMIFTLASSAQEWLNVKWDEIRKAAEEAKQKRFEGTRVTVESFLAWKAKFGEEFLGQKGSERNARDPAKLTGRELFLADTSLVQSDLKFLDDGGEADVKVDESLFQYLELAEEDFDEDSS